MQPREEYEKWLKNPFLSAEEKEYLKSISQDEATIEELFHQDLTFGTGGMRGVIGVGTNRINRYQVAKATQAFAAHLIKKAGGRVRKPVAVGYDTRRMSAEFAETALRVLLGNGIGVARFRGPRPVPQMSYVIRELDLAGGILITASHNPKEYNGYKVYSSYGGQLVPEDMEDIMFEFKKIKEFNQVHPYVGHLRLSSILNTIGISLDERFQKAVCRAAVNEEFHRQLGIVYSPLHGTGAVCVPQVLEKRGFSNVWTVQAQMEPDPDFSTVRVPNPEDHSALSMAIQLAKEKQADMVLATDPDCDRVGVAFRNEAGEYISLTGNQIGALLIDYIVRFRKDMPPHPVMIQTVVTGGLGKKIAQEAGLEVQEVLTGFKYIGQRMTEFEQADLPEEQKKHFVFGYEESYGCLSAGHARDKDGANACMLLAEMEGFYRQEGTCALERLSEIYRQYGYFSDQVENIAFTGIEGMKEMGEVMERVRKAGCSSLGGRKALMIDFEKTQETGLPQENALKFLLEDGSFAALRPSGTEPKLKMYFSCRGASMEQAQQLCEQLKEELMAVSGIQK